MQYEARELCMPERRVVLSDKGRASFAKRAAEAASVLGIPLGRVVIRPLPKTKAA